MSRFKIVGIGLALALMTVSGCPNIDADGLADIYDILLDAFDIDDEPGITLLVHPDDPHIAQIISEAGDRFEVFGTKDADGLPIAMDTIRHQLPEQIGTDEATWLRFDENEQLSEIEAEDGMSFRFTWIDDTTAIIEFLTADGVVQGMLAHDFYNPEDEITLSAAKLRANTPRITRKAPMKTADLRGRSKSEQMFVRVTKCGEAVSDARVAIILTEQSGAKRTRWYRALPAVDEDLGNGYAVMLPTSDPASSLTLDTLNSICSAAAPLLAGGCTVTAVTPPGGEVAICAKISLLIDTATAGPSGIETAAYTSVCVSGFEALRLYCATLGARGVSGNQSATDAFCEGVKKRAAALRESEQVTIQASVYVPGEDKQFSAPVTVPATGPFGSITVRMPAEPSIKALYNSPRVPEATDSYVATAELTCLERGTSVTLTVEDRNSGQVYSTTQTSDTTAGNMTISVTVPARDEILDLISVEIEGGPSRHYPLVIYAEQDPDPDPEPEPGPDPGPDPDSDLDIQTTCNYYDYAQTMPQACDSWYLEERSDGTHRVFHGPSRQWYTSGALLYETIFVHGVAGCYTWYNEDGSIRDTNCP